MKFGRFQIFAYLHMPMFCSISVWKISKDEQRWKMCNENQICNCDSSSKHVTCQINGCLNKHIHIPYDAENM